MCCVSDSPSGRPAAASEITLDAVFRRSARLFADRTAVVGPDRRLTYAQLDQRSNRLANGLIDAGIAPGERIAVLANPCPEFVELYVAAAKLGVTVIALNTRLHPKEITYCLTLTEPRLIFAADELRELLVSGGEVARGGAERPAGRPEPEAIHNVLFTSGTTGRPRGAMISQRAAAVRAYRCAQWFGLGPEDGFIGWLPLFHCGGDEPLYATLLSGARIATLPRADPEAMFAAVQRERLTWTLLLPGVITEFLGHPRRADYDLSSLRFAIGYANMMPQVGEGVHRRGGRFLGRVRADRVELPGCLRTRPGWERADAAQAADAAAGHPDRR
jgi:fatty-acyl-CoA synthase